MATESPQSKTKKTANEIKFDPDEVQIKSSYTAVKNRVNYFLKRKQEEYIERNTRLYCPESKAKFYGSSRTCDTIAVKRQKNSECFVKRSKANNTSGPLIDGIDPASENSYAISTGLEFTGPRSDIRERISNIERCMNIESEDDDSCYKTNADIYKKLKSIEDKIMEFQHMVLEKNKQEMLLAKKNLVKEQTSSPVDVRPKKSKYTTNDIQNLINSIKRNIK